MVARSGVTFPDIVRATAKKSCHAADCEIVEFDVPEILGVVRVVEMRNSHFRIPVPTAMASMMLLLEERTEAAEAAVGIHEWVQAHTVVLLVAAVHAVVQEAAVDTSMDGTAVGRKLKAYLPLAPKELRSVALTGMVAAVVVLEVVRYSMVVLADTVAAAEAVQVGTAAAEEDESTGNEDTSTELGRDNTVDQDMGFQTLWTENAMHSISFNRRNRVEVDNWTTDQESVNIVLTSSQSSNNGRYDSIGDVVFTFTCLGESPG